MGLLIKHTKCIREFLLFQKLSLYFANNLKLSKCIVQNSLILPSKSNKKNIQTKRKGKNSYLLINIYQLMSLILPSKQKIQASYLFRYLKKKNCQLSVHHFSQR